MSWECLSDEIAEMFAEYSGGERYLQAEADAVALRTEQHRLSAIERYHDARARGLCGYCKTAQAVPGRVLCAGCMSVEDPRTHDRYHSARAAGLCGYCRKQPALSGRSLCDVCLPRERARSREKALRGAARPAVVKARAAERYRATRESGLCTSCRKAPPRPNRVHCVGCAAIIKAGNRARLARRAAARAALGEPGNRCGLCGRVGHNRRACGNVVVLSERGVQA